MTTHDAIDPFEDELESLDGISEETVTESDLKVVALQSVRLNRLILRTKLPTEEAIESLTHSMLALLELLVHYASPEALTEFCVLLIEMDPLKLPKQRKVARSTLVELARLDPEDGLRSELSLEEMVEKTVQDVAALKPVSKQGESAQTATLALQRQLFFFIESASKDPHLPRHCLEDLFEITKTFSEHTSFSGDEGVEETLAHLQERLGK